MNCFVAYLEVYYRYFSRETQYSCQGDRPFPRVKNLVAELESNIILTDCLPQEKAAELKEELDRVQYKLDLGRQDVQDIDKKVRG